MAELGLGGGVIVVPNVDPNPLKWRSVSWASAGFDGADVTPQNQASYLVSPATGFSSFGVE